MIKYTYLYIYHYIYNLKKIIKIIKKLLYNLNNEVKWNEIIRGSPVSLNKYRYLIPDVR